MLRQCIINFIWQPDQSCTMLDDNMQTNTWAYEWSLHKRDSNGSTGDDLLYSKILLKKTKGSLATPRTITVYTGSMHMIWKANGSHLLYWWL